MRVAEAHRLLDVVGDEHDRLAQLPLQPQELALQPVPRDRVDGAERLVHQQHRRIGRQGPGHAGPLALAARQLGGVALGEAGGVQADQLQQLCGAGPDAVLVPSEQAGHGARRCRRA